jgi:hypothetical protein
MRLQSVFKTFMAPVEKVSNSGGARSRFNQLLKPLFQDSYDMPKVLNGVIEHNDRIAGIDPYDWDAVSLVQGINDSLRELPVLTQENLTSWKNELLQTEANYKLSNAPPVSMQEILKSSNLTPNEETNHQIRINNYTSRLFQHLNLVGKQTAHKEVDRRLVQDNSFRDRVWEIMRPFYEGASEYFKTTKEPEIKAIFQEHGLTGDNLTEAARLLRSKNILIQESVEAPFGKQLIYEQSYPQLDQVVDLGIHQFEKPFGEIM